MVPPASRRVSRVPRYSGTCLLTCHFAYGVFTLSDRLSQNRSAITHQYFLQARNPYRITSLGLTCSNFARRYFRNRFFFLFLPLLRCFSSRRSLPYTIFFIYGYMSFSHVGSPIRTSTARWIFAPPRGFSQLITSFFGSQCQGILLLPFFA